MPGSPVVASCRWGRAVTASPEGPRVACCVRSFPLLPVRVLIPSPSRLVTWFGGYQLGTGSDREDRPVNVLGAWRLVLGADRHGRVDVYAHVHTPRPRPHAILC
jgi:hypothetical protein